VAFLKALTDQRVVQRSAPFDHPQLFVPNGHETIGSFPIPDLDGVKNRILPLKGFLKP
jgi:hypothetical protein